MFLRAATAFTFSLIGIPAAALCVGDSYLDQITETQSAELNAAVADIAFAEGIIWNATRGGDSLKIIGTMHIYDPRLEPIFEQVAGAVTGADIILVEATPEDQDALQAQMTNDPTQLFLGDGPTLPELLDEETWQKLAGAAADRNVPAFIAAKMQPWYLSIVLSMPPCAMDDVMAGNFGLDHMIMGAATDAGIPMQSLEDYRTLFGIFQNETQEDQLDILRMNLMAPEIQQQVFVSMMDRYFAQDIGTLWEMSRVALSDLSSMDAQAATELFDETQIALLDDRNRNWIPVITQAASENDDIVIAVGAAHLIGDNGILNLLQNEGWTITRDD